MKLHAIPSPLDEEGCRIDEVLVASPDPITRTTLCTALKKWGYEVTEATTSVELSQVAQEDDAPQLWIVDDALGDVPRVSALRARPDSAAVYILVLVDDASDEHIQHLLERGADDFLVKPLAMAKLRLRLRAGQRIVELQAELSNVRNELDAESTRDSLTSVLNRPTLLKELGRELNRCDREGTALAIALVEIDGFGGILGAFGRLAADDVLCDAACRINAALRCYDSVGRCGAETFALLLPGCNHHEAQQVIDRIRQAINAPALNTVAGPLVVTASFGLVVQPERKEAKTSAANAEWFLQRADEALRSAQENGGNMIAVCSEVVSEAGLSN
ncbi:MAG: diguanylate cyclase [Deltaproteobacteria bacterium]|nr:diguanylate cyclase [Deltaproteobacteria bacterium]